MARASRQKPEEIDPKNSCHGCGSLCCRYVAVQIPPPRHREECELIRWYLAHRDVCVYIDPEGDWLVQVATECRHLIDHRCAIYPERPEVCREYETHTCELTGSGEENIAEFHSAEEFERFFRANFRWEGDRVRRRHRSYRKPAP